jgi:hypothetical protein
MFELKRTYGQPTLDVGLPRNLAELPRHLVDRIRRTECELAELERACELAETDPEGARKLLERLDKNRMLWPQPS